MDIGIQIAKGENKTIEFKEKLPQSSNIAKTVIAFSNGGGGKLIIGVKDNCEIVGVTDQDVIELPDKISNIIYDMCYPVIIPEMYTTNIENRMVFVVEIFPGNLRPYYMKSEGRSNGVYVRVGATNKKADAEMVSELERQRMNKSFDEEIVYDFEETNLDVKKLQKAFNGYAGKVLDKEQMLNLKLYVIEKERMLPTTAMLLLADTSNALEYARLKCARFKGDHTNEFIDRKEYTGPLYEQIEQAMIFMQNHLFKNGRIEGLQRKDEYELPIPAIREAITNAVIHRDYSISGSDIKINIFDSRIEIISPGGLPKTLSIEDIKSGRSEIRNKVIARFFKEINFIEQWGTGIRRIISTCFESGLKEPDFSENGMFFTVIFYRTASKNVREVSENVREVSENVREVIGNFRKYKIDTLSLHEKMIIEFLAVNHIITKQKVMELTNLSSSGAKNLLNSLKKQGLVYSRGKSRATFYELVEQ